MPESRPTVTSADNAAVYSRSATTKRMSFVRSAERAISSAVRIRRTQLVPLREYAAERQATEILEYVDRGESGAKTSRPELDRMMAHARRRRFDAVLVFRFDR